MTTENQSNDTPSNCTGISSISATVDNTQASTSIHVADLDGSRNVKGRSGKWEAFATVTIRDTEGGLVPNATVEGQWNNAATTVSAITATDGTVTFASGDLTSESVTFSVVDVVHGTYAYDSKANSDPDGDSDGTNITISKSGTAGASDLDALYDYLAETSRTRQSNTKDADNEIAAVDLLMMQGV